MLNKKMALSVIGAAATLLAPAVLALANPLASVEQQGRAFRPNHLQITKGQSVLFTNNDPYGHQLYVTSKGFNYESGLQPPGSTKQITFTELGSFQVLCAIHPRMVLDVEVQ